MDKDRRRLLDHLRYLSSREERKEKQRKYYQNNRDKVIKSVRRCQQKREEKYRLLLAPWTMKNGFTFKRDE